jgi:alpha-beta hydrolase superfamily lysophospholipase
VSHPVAARIGRHPRRLAACIAIAVGVVALVPPGLLYLRLHPGRVELADDPGRHGLAYQAIEFASPLDGTPLRGWYLPSPRPTGRAIVIVPGIDDDREVSGITLRLAPALLQAGFDVLAFDLRGEGESGPGPITFGAREQWDVLGAVREARVRGADHVGVLGFSLGASSSIMAAARWPEIDAVVADSPFFDLTETLTRQLVEGDRVPSPVAAYALAWYRPLSGTSLDEVSPGQVVGSITPRPLLIVHGIADRTLPPSESERVFAEAGPTTTQLWLVPGGAHAQSYLADPSGYERRVTAFFEASLPRSPG